MTDVLPVEIELPLPRQIQILLKRRRERNCKRAAEWRASFPPLPLTSAPLAKVCVPPTSALPTSTGFSQREAATNAPAEFQPFRAKKCTAGFDAFFAEWQRKHPDWVHHQDSIAAMQMKSEPVPVVAQPLLPAKPASSAIGPKLRGCKSVVCRNLSTIVAEDEIWEFFLPCMSICRMKLVFDPATGASKGVAYVAFDDEADVGEALKLHGTELRGKPMRIECFFGKWPR